MDEEKDNAAIIAEQTAEIQRLRRLLEGARFADELREALSLAALAGTIAAPVTHSRLLEMIVETAAHVISAHAGALFLIDEESEELVFEVALGQKADEVKKFRVPLGHGIAGLVAVTGQPMAVADAEQNEQQARDIATSVGYIPQSILCVPLYSNDRVIGVLELLDKNDADTFSAEDMYALSLFANQAAVAIEQSRIQGNVAGMLSDALASVGGLSEEHRERMRERARAFATSIVTEDPVYDRAIELARTVRDISGRGEDEAAVCQRILTSFAGYLSGRPGPMGGR